MKFSDSRQPANVVEEEPVQPVEWHPKEILEVQTEPIQVEETKTLQMVVTDCDSLNARKDANVESEVLEVLPKNEVVLAHNFNSKDEWVKISLNDNLETYAFVMSKYVRKL